MILINAIKRLIYGTTTQFSIKQDSCALRGTSFTSLWTERMEFPTQIVAIDIKIENKHQAMWRITVDGEKVFPFADENSVVEGLVHIMPVEVAAGSMVRVEVRGMSATDRNVVILSELDIVERR